MSESQLATTTTTTTTTNHSTSHQSSKAIPGGLCVIENVWVSGVHSGFKHRNKDLALIYFPKGATMAGVFTKNAIQSHHIKYDKKRLNEQATFKAIMINSGNANTFNGPTGDTDVQAMANSLAKKLMIKPDEVLICSTGVIGVPMDLTDFDDKVDLLSHNLTDGDSIQAAEAIMTTDTKIKQAAIAFEIEGQPVHLAAIAKGSGMIHPNMGTMLSYIVTDLDLGQATLQQLLKESVGQSFNKISVDGDTSPNDTVLLASTNKVSVKPTKQNILIFQEKLTEICQMMAQEIVTDGEGATKFVTVAVKGAAGQADAEAIAKQVATSSLVKTAVYGQDANWGRVLSAIGQTQPDYLDPAKVQISFISDKGEVPTCKNGQGLVFDEDLAYEILSETDITIHIDLGLGKNQTAVWTCDMTEDYIKVNADYRS
ncbi:bifunctional glutamate N-acetyltransferase/amino-acid acetyltransferase ArgJ [Aerococcus viridans]|uniref:bifunctional glutamate N-acetyltransferase/amino-acid acetyltransferase ArgJ n=1 Tax=Aerococcus viridans TaxID=1377 RepID=UPI0037FD7FCA